MGSRLVLFYNIWTSLILSTFYLLIGTYSGRAKHFFAVTNPINLLCSSAQLDHAKDIVQRYRFLFLSICIIFLSFIYIIEKVKIFPDWLKMNCGDANRYTTRPFIRKLEKKWFLSEECQHRCRWIWLLLDVSLVLIFKKF